MVKFLLPLVGSLCLGAACHNRVVIEHAREMGTSEVPYQLDSSSLGKTIPDSVIVIGKGQISADDSLDELFK